MENNNETTSDTQFKIGMIAPSGVGKTSLLTAICDEVQRRIESEPLSFFPEGTKTNDAMKKARALFNTVINSSNNLFDVPKFMPTSDITEYTYSVNVHPSNTKEKTLDIRFSIMDYPGGMLKNVDEFNVEIMPHIRDSVALLVPISADILMDWSKTRNSNDPLIKQRNDAADKMLDVDNVLRAVTNWLEEKTRRKQSAQLFFVPVKCEKYFNDNGGQYDQSTELLNAIHERYIKPLALSPETRNLVQVNVFSIDTYGVVELRDVSTVMDNGEMILLSTFQRRINLERKLKTKNAYELLMNILKFQMNVLFKKIRDLRDDYQDNLNKKIQASKSFEDEKEELLDAIAYRTSNYTPFQWILYMIIRDRELEKMNKTLKELEAQEFKNEADKVKYRWLLEPKEQDYNRLKSAINVLITLIKAMPNRQQSYSL